MAETRNRDDPIDVAISAIEHFAYCPRQCALIHLEGVFTDNLWTTRGRIAHERVHSGEATTEDGIPIRRDVSLVSERLGLVGRADLVEMRPEGPYPVEYKSGRRHGDYPDLQLCAQALCLEEMTCKAVPRGAIYHVASRTRREVELGEPLRQRTMALIEAIRQMLRSQTLPPPAADQRCRRCSLQEVCLPQVVAAPRRLAGLQGALFRVYDQE